MAFKKTFSKSIYRGLCATDLGTGNIKMSKTRPCSSLASLHLQHPSEHLQAGLQEIHPNTCFCLMNIMCSPPGDVCCSEVQNSGFMTRDYILGCSLCQTIWLCMMCYLNCLFKTLQYNIYTSLSVQITQKYE